MLSINHHLLVLEDPLRQVCNKPISYSEKTLKFDKKGKKKSVVKKPAGGVAAENKISA